MDKPISFYKTLGNFDRIEVSATGSQDWLQLTMHVGHDAEIVRMMLRSEEAVRDLHYALGRYLALCDEADHTSQPTHSLGKGGS